MPKNWPQSFKDSSKQTSRQHITLYRVTLTDGTVYKLAHSDTDVTAKISGTDTLFQAFGFRRTQATSHMNLQIDNMEITVPNVELLMSDNKTKKRLGDFALQGLMDNAKIELFTYDGDNPTVNAVVHSVWLVQQCTVKKTAVLFRCESHNVIADREGPRTIFQELCNNQLYDKYCGVSRAAFEVTTALWGGPIPNFSDLFNRVTLGSDWTQDGTGTITLDGSTLQLEELTAEERLAVKRPVPAGRPTMMEVDVSFGVPSTNTFRIPVVAIGDNVHPTTNAYRIEVDWNGTNNFSILVNGGSAERQFATLPASIKFRLYWNGVTAWGAYTIDGGETWGAGNEQSSSTSGVLSARVITPTSPQYWLADSRVSGAGNGGASAKPKFDNYREWSGGDIGITDSRIQPAAGKIRIRGAQPSNYYDVGEATMQTGALLNVKRTIKSHVHVDRQVGRFALTTYSLAPSDDAQREKMTNLFEPRTQGQAGVVTWVNPPAASPYDIDLDFGAARTYRKFIMNFMEVSPGGPTQRPASVEFFKSTDGVVFTSLGTVLRANMTRVDAVIWEQWYRATLTLGADETTRYVRARITNAGGNPNVEIGEFQVIHSNGEEIITFLQELPLVPLEGDSIKVAPGCDKRLTTCKNKFNNLVPAAGGGFRGFPTIPKPTDPF